MNVAAKAQTSYQQVEERQTHTYGSAGGSNCGGQPTEKERMIAQLMKEAADLRQRERDYKILQD